MSAALRHLSGLQAGSYFFAEYAEDDYLHERLLVGWSLDKKRLYIYTRDGDLYEEDPANYSVVHLPGVRGGLPPSAASWGANGRGVRVLRIDHVEASQLLPQLVVRVERDRGPVAQLVVRPGLGAIVPAGDGDGADDDDGDDLPGVYLGTGRPSSMAADEVWVSMEDKGPFVKGQPIDFSKVDFAHTHDRGVAQICMDLVAVAKLGAFVVDAPTPRGEDLRTLPVIFDGQLSSPCLQRKCSRVHGDQVRRLASGRPEDLLVALQGRWKAGRQP